MRKYQIGNEKYISITTLLGLTKDKTFLDAWKKRVGEAEANRISNFAANRGTQLHKKIENFLLGEEVQLDPLFYNIKPYLERLEPEFLEHQVYNHHLKIAGTTDCIGTYQGQRSIIDFKNALKPKRKEWITDYFLQCSFYSICHEEMTGERIDQLVVIISSDEECQEFVESRKNFLTECGQRYKMYKDLETQ